MASSTGSSGYKGSRIKGSTKAAQRSKSMGSYSNIGAPF